MLLSHLLAKLIEGAKAVNREWVNLHLSHEANTRSKRTPGFLQAPFIFILIVIILRDRFHCNHRSSLYSYSSRNCDEVIKI